MAHSGGGPSDGIRRTHARKLNHLRPAWGLVEPRLPVVARCARHFLAARPLRSQRGMDSRGAGTSLAARNEGWQRGTACTQRVPESQYARPLLATPSDSSARGMTRGARIDVSVARNESAQRGSKKLSGKSVPRCEKWFRAARRRVAGRGNSF